MSTNTPLILIAKRPSDNAELFCYPTKTFGENGLIRLADGRIMECSVTVALEKMPFFMYDPAKVEEPYRRAVIERIQSGEAINDWLSGAGLKIDVPPPPPPAPPVEEKNKDKTPSSKPPKLNGIGKQ